MWIFSYWYHVTSPWTPKGLIKSIKNNCTNTLYLLRIWKPFLNFQRFLAHYVILWSFNLVAKIWVFKFPRKFQKGTNMLATTLLWLQSPSQVVTQSPILLVSPKIETYDAKNKMIPGSHCLYCTPKNRSALQPIPLGKRIHGSHYLACILPNIMINKKSTSSRGIENS